MLFFYGSCVGMMIYCFQQATTPPCCTCLMMLFHWNTIKHIFVHYYMKSFLSFLPAKLICIEPSHIHLAHEKPFKGTMLQEMMECLMQICAGWKIFRIFLGVVANKFFCRCLRVWNLMNLSFFSMISFQISYANFIESNLFEYNIILIKTLIQ